MLIDRLFYSTICLSRVVNRSLVPIIFYTDRQTGGRLARALIENLRIDALPIINVSHLLISLRSFIIAK